MSTCEIKPKDNERNNIGQFVKGTNVRHFEQRIVRRIQERLVKNPDVERLSKNIESVGGEVGGTSRISEMIANLPMIINGAVAITFNNEINDRLEQEIEVKIDHTKLRKNLGIYFSGELLRRSNAKHETLAFVHNLNEEPIESVYLYAHWVDEQGEISCEVTKLEEIQLGNAWICTQVNAICEPLTEDFNEVVAYLQGRKK